jgi:hypothetical protein
MGLIMLPNIVYAIRVKDGGVRAGRTVTILEQVGRYGCFIGMVLNIPPQLFGFRSATSFALYLLINAGLLLAYCLIWIVCFRKNNLFRALSLSILPSVIFLFSGLISCSLLLILSALIFAPCHIYISYKSAAK